MQGSCNTTNNATISPECVAQFFETTALSNITNAGSDVTTAETMGDEHVVVWVPYVGLLFIIGICIVLAVSFYQRQKRVQKRRQNAMDYLELNIDLKRKRLHAIMHAKTSIEDVVREAFYHGLLPNASNSIRIQPLPLNQPVTNFKLSCSPKSFEENAEKIHGSIQPYPSKGDSNYHKKEKNGYIDSQCYCHCCTNYDCNSTGCQHISVPCHHYNNVNQHTLHRVLRHHRNNKRLIKAHENSHQFYNENELPPKRKISKKGSKTSTHSKKSNNLKGQDIDRVKESSNNDCHGSSTEKENRSKKDNTGKNNETTPEYSQVAWSSLNSHESENELMHGGNVKFEDEDKSIEMYKQIPVEKTKSYGRADVKPLPHKTWARTITLNNEDLSPTNVTLVSDETYLSGKKFLVGFKDLNHSEYDTEIMNSIDANNEFDLYEKHGVSFPEKGSSNGERPEGYKNSEKGFQTDKQAGDKGRRMLGDGIEEKSFNAIAGENKNSSVVHIKQSAVQRLETQPLPNHPLSHDQFQTDFQGSSEGFMNHGYKPDSFETFYPALSHSPLYDNHFHGAETPSLRPEILSVKRDVSFNDDASRPGTKLRDTLDTISDMNVYSIDQDFNRDQRQQFYYPSKTVAYSNNGHEPLPTTSNGDTYTVDQSKAQTDLDSSPSTISNSSFRRAKKRRKTFLQNGRRSRKLSDSSLNLSPKITQVFQVSGNIPDRQYNDTEEYV